MNFSRCKILIFNDFVSEKFYHRLLQHLPEKEADKEILNFTKYVNCKIENIKKADKGKINKF